MSFVNLFAQGVLLGGYYALLACGLSLMFGVMRIINLAHGDLAILAAFLVFSISDRFGLSPFLSLVAVLPIMAVAGWALQRGILERSLRSGMLVPLLATFGLSIVLENLLFEAYGADTRSLGGMIGDLVFDSLEVTSQFSVSYLAALVFALAVALLGGLSIFLKYTSLGCAIRATSEDPDTAELVGIDSARGLRRGRGDCGRDGRPRRRDARHAGDLRSLFRADAAHLRLRGRGHRRNWFVVGHADRWDRARPRAVDRGDDQPEAVFARRSPDLPRGARASAFSGLGAGAGRSAFGAGARRMNEGSKFSVDRWTRELAAFGIAVSLVVVALAATPLVAGANVVDKLTTLFIYVILAAMWNALAGYAGLVSVGQQAFFGIGAYFAIRLSAAGFPAYPSLLAGAVGAALLAIPVSFFMLRLRGGEFSIGMWVLAETLHLIVNLDPMIQGETGASMIALNAFAPAERLMTNYWLSLGSMLALLAAIFLLLRSPFGASVQAIRDDEEAAASIGVRVLAAKRTVFILAAFGCALAGVLWLATSITFQPKTNFGVQWTAYMILMTLVGGLGTFEGPILGALFFFVVQNEFGENGVWYMAGLGVVAILFALFLPRGLWGEIEARTGLRLLPVGYRLRVTARPHAKAGD